MQKLEIYAIALAAALILTVGAFFVGEFKGKYEEQASAAQKLEAANSKAIDTYATTLKDRADADSQSIARSQALIAAYDQGLQNVHATLAKLQPTVVKGADGCPAFTGTAKLRWDAIELLPAGPTDAPAGAVPPSGLPTGPVPAPR